jgi:hypothetical protein
MERPNLKSCKDKTILSYIEHLENQLKSPFADSYMAIKKIVDRGNHQLNTTEIDIFDPEHEKKSAMIGKFLDKLESYSKQMEYFKSKMNPDEIKASLIVKSEGVEEFLKEKGL